jgi:hypothetical protein
MVAKRKPRHLVGNVDHKLAAKLVTILKRAELQHVKKREWGHALFTVGMLMTRIDIPAKYDTRRKRYVEVMQALKHAEQLGLVTSQGDSPRRFYYKGPEVEAMKQVQDNERKAQVQAVKQLTKTLRLRGVYLSEELYSDSTVTLPVKEFLKLQQLAQ